MFHFLKILIVSKNCYQAIWLADISYRSRC